MTNTGLHFVVCTRGTSSDAQTVRSLRAHGLGETITVYENNQEGLPTCYNRVLNARQDLNEIVVFLHDDIAIWDIMLTAKLIHARGHLGYSIIGLAGAKTLDCNPNKNGIVGWDSGVGAPRSGAVEHELPNGQSFVITFGPTPAECEVIDGFFIGVDMRAIGKTRFDERFNFHFYDLDFCIAARKAGLRIGVKNIHVMHFSMGNFRSEKFHKAQIEFLSKHKQYVSRS